MRADRHALGSGADSYSINYFAKIDICGVWVDVNNREAIAPTVRIHSYGRKRQSGIPQLVGDGHGAWIGSGASHRHVHLFDDNEIRGVGRHTVDHDVEHVVMRHREEWSRDSGRDYPPGQIYGYIYGWNRLAVQTNLRSGQVEAGPENLHADQIACRSQGSLRNKSLGNAADDPGAGIGTWNDHLSNLCRIRGVQRARTQINDLDAAGARLHDKRLVGDRINGDASPQGKAVRRAIRDGDIGRPYCPARHRNQSVARPGYRIGDGNLVHRSAGSAGIISNDGIGIRLPSNSRRPRNFTGSVAGNRERGATGLETDGRNGLIKLIENVDLLAGGVGVRERGGMTDRIDGDTLRGVGKPAENEVRFAKENGTRPVGSSGTRHAGPQGVCEGRAAGDGNGEDPVKVKSCWRAATRICKWRNAGNQNSGGDSRNQTSERGRAGGRSRHSASVIDQRAEGNGSR